MKTFNAKKIDVIDDNGVPVTRDENGKPIDISFKTFAMNALRFPIQDIDAVKLCELSDLIRKIKPMETGDEIELTDEEFNLLRESVMNMKFKAVSEDWADFITYLKNQK